MVIFPNRAYVAYLYYSKVDNRKTMTLQRLTIRKYDKKELYPQFIDPFQEGKTNFPWQTANNRQHLTGCSIIPFRSLTIHMYKEQVCCREAKKQKHTSNYAHYTPPDLGHKSAHRTTRFPTNYAASKTARSTGCEWMMSLSWWGFGLR